MASDQVVIELTTEEEITVEYWKVCNIRYEMERIDNGKDGFVDVYLAKCIKDGDDYVELDYDQQHFKIEGGEFSQFEAYDMIPSVDPTCFDFIRTVSQFLIDKGYVDGTVVID